MRKLQYPDEYSFPDALTFKAQDTDGNIRDVTYYRADAVVNICGRVKDVFALDRKRQSWDPPRGGSSQQGH